MEFLAKELKEYILLSGEVGAWDLLNYFHSLSKIYLEEEIVKTCYEKLDAYNASVSLSFYGKLEYKLAEKYLRLNLERLPEPTDHLKKADRENVVYYSHTGLLALGCEDAIPVLEGFIKGIPPEPYLNYIEDTTWMDVCDDLKHMRNSKAQKMIDDLLSEKYIDIDPVVRERYLRFRNRDYDKLIQFWARYIER